MEETSSSALDGEITGIRFGLASRKEVCAASVGDCSITHAIQLSNPFLGLPLESGRCESCGTSDPDKCEGHFGYIELPIPIFHPSHVGELKRMLSLLCFKCLKMRNNKFPIKNVGVGEQLLASCCADAAQVSIRDVKTSEGAHCLQLRRSKLRSADGFLRSPDGFWNFLERYGFRYGDNLSRPLLPCEVMEILKRLPEETKRKLVGKGYFPQDGYIIQYLPVPPNCLSVPDISDGVTVMSSDLSVSMLRKVLRQVEIIKNSRSGTPNFESHDIEAQDLQVVVNEYLQVRGTAKASRDVDARFGIRKEQSDSATKAWLEKMRTLFIRKGSGFSSRSVITGDAYKKVSEIGIPSEIAQRITFEEKVSIHNIIYLQNLVDKKLCLAYRDGAATYSLREGSKGHTSLRPGQVVHRRIVDGDVVFINRPPTTHKHSLQALSVYIHEDHTVKINPLICGPLGADFDGDCVHLFYPQSLSAKAEVLELFSVDKQLLSSHSGNLNLQLATDSLLSLKVMFRKYFYDKLGVQQLAMYASSNLPQPALLKAHRLCKTWTALQILETALPAGFDCCGDRYLIKKSEILDVDYSKDFIASMINEVVSSIFFEKNAKEVLKFFDALQPLLMENIFVEGFSVCLEDFYISQSMIRDIHKSLQSISPLLLHLRTTDNELLQLQLENHIRFVKLPVSQFILKSSALGDLVDSKSDSAINKVVQQIGFLGVQISNKGKFYSESLFDEMASLFHRKYSYAGVHYPSGEYGLIKSSFIGGLDPYEMMVHSISTREVIVRSTRGLSEPGTLFKNLMAILRDVTICYDGTVRNVCSNSIIQFEYGFGRRGKDDNLFPPGEPVGVLAATAMSNPAYKAVLDSSPSSNSSWELMKEILQCRVNYKNEAIDRRVILYLNRCGCGRKHCNENAACLVKSHLKKVSLKDIAVNFMIEYKDLGMVLGGSEHHAGLVGHVHLNQALLKDLNITMSDVLQRCQTTINLNRKKKKNGKIFKATVVSVSEGCTFQPLSAHKRSQMPCLMFSCLDAYDIELEKVRHVLADIIFPVLVETIIKGDPRICSANIVWINPPTTSWMRSSRRNCKGELALDIVLDKSVCKRSGDAWRIVVDSCLPILHLIDTRRSVPYAIKQVEELLGISCAFDQAAQRLSSSVTAVAKGVLKEHLILLADSMTCSGNLIGFNSAGYKAFSRSLNIQVPFTEATLVTPRKCFERASVKCHMDSLSSIVASCSWGKRVAVGTGSRFDLLWGTKEVDLRHNGVTTDLYSFLHMVRGPNAEAEGGTACLGAEVDHLDWEVESTDLNLSPQNDHNSDRPVFEDIIDHNSDGWVASAWGKSGDGSENGNAWKTNSETQEKQSQWEQQTLGSVAKGWGRKAEDADRARSGWEDSQLAEAKDLGKKEEDSDTRGSGWEGSTHVEATTWAKKADVDMLGSGWNNSKTEEKQSQWEQQTTGGEAKGWGRKAEDSDMAGGGWEGSKLAEAKGWGKKAGDNDTHGRGWTGSNHVEATTWAKKADANTLGGGWNSSEHSEVTGWGKKAKDDDVHGSGWNGTQRTEATGWGQKAEGDDMHGSGWIGAQRAEAKGWGKKAGDSDTHGSGWKGSDRVEATTWAEKADSDMRGSGWNSSEHTETISWGKKEDDDAHVSGWNGTQRAEAAGWGKKAEDNTHGSEWNGTPGWRKKAEDGDTPVSGRNASQNAEEMELGKKAEDGEMPGSGWKSSQHTESTGWSEKAVDVGTPGRGWNGSQVAGVQQSNDPNPWRSDSRKKGKGTNSEWRSRRSLSRPRELANDDSNSARMFTLTRQRLDMFTSEEQDMLVEVEGIMQSIRRIMHQSGYNDNDPLSAEDQSYIIDNVLNHHPDKAAKMGAGIEHITVSKHGSFQDSRCFFVVSTDGGRVDFSYRKCLENYIRAKYPDAADPFIGKYFRRPRSEGKREQSVAPGTPAPGESGTENSENR